MSREQTERGDDPPNPYRISPIAWLPSIPGNDYATSFFCSWSDPRFGILTPKDLELLQHVNCSYLSSGKAPTLLALKQHAQSLTNLIRKLSVHGETFGLVHAIANDAPVELQVRKDEAFDWLNNLDEAYTNDDEGHHWPLWALANFVKEEEQFHRKEYRCPLEETSVWDTKPADFLARPWATHQNLVKHANHCLEIIDHEYCASGGLMGLLPTDGAKDGDELEGLRNTILGQWLLYHQHLVARMHELEICYGNALDLLAGEAVVPKQRLGPTGPDARGENHRVVYPQDRFILANAGDDVLDFLHRELDQAEADLQSKDEVWKDSGVSGERLWTKAPGSEEFLSRGIVPVEFKSRFYRIKGHGHESPIFVVPIIDKHPGVAATREMESRPTVVTMLAAPWPERATELDAKYRAAVDGMEASQRVQIELTKALGEAKRESNRHAAEAKRARALLKRYETAHGKFDVMVEDED